MTAVAATAEADRLLLELALRVGRRPLREAEDTSTRILREAIALFGLRGYAGTSMRDLADVVGIRPPSIYAHFASKEQVLAAALLDTLDAFHAFLLEAVEAGRPAAAQLEALVRQHVRWQLRFQPLAGSWDVLWEVESAAGNLGAAACDELRRRRASHHDVVAALVRDVRPDLDGRRTAEAMLALCDRAPAWAAMDDGASEDAVVDAAWTTIGRLVA